MRRLKIKEDKKGSIMDIFIWMTVAFILILFFAGWIYGYGLMVDALENVKSTPTVNISDAVDASFGRIEPAQKIGLHVLAYVIIFMMAVSIIVSSFLVKANPAFFVIYVMIAIGGIIASVVLSNIYEGLMVDKILGSTISEFTGGSFIMLNLPIWVTIITFAGAIFLFSGILRDRGAGGSVV